VNQKNKFDIQPALDALNITIEELNELSETGSVVRINYESVYCKQSKVHGYGMFAKKDIAENEIIGLASVDNKYKTYIGRYTNHSNHPNICFLYNETNDLVAKATQVILKGQEIFLNYSLHILYPEKL